MLLQLKQRSDTSEKLSSIFIGGGSDLFVQKPDELQDTDIVLLTDKRLRYIKEKSSRIEIGGGTTFEDIKQSDVFRKILPSISGSINLIASLPVRNAATIGGNLANASPIGDLTIILLALDAKLLLTNDNSERSLPLSEFYLDYKLINKNSDEYIKSISFNIPGKNNQFSFEKVSKRTYLDIANVNSAMYVEVESNVIKSINISAGGISPIPKLLTKTCEFLIGKTISNELIKKSFPVTSSEISPISDVRGSADYKRLLLRQLIYAHFIKLFPELIQVEELI
jgi:xanthine dehydrogenase small subunit